jgi:hypothetical protein
MSMQALNRLVARSIVDPSILQAFGAGQIGQVLGELDFSPEMRRTLTGLESGSWAEFAIQAYGSSRRPRSRLSASSFLPDGRPDGRAGTEAL